MMRTRIAVALAATFALAACGANSDPLSNDTGKSGSQPHLSLRHSIEDPDR